jgi:hypothetical protein
VIDPALLRRTEGRAPEQSWGRPPVLASPDLTRILALPRRPPPDGAKSEALIDLMSERLGRENPDCKCAEWGRGCITRLRSVQAWALYELGLRRGLLAPINVGDGKTMIDVLAALVLPARTVLLLVPAKLVGQLVREYLRIREHFRVPALVVHGDGTSVRSDEPTVLHVISYERLSRADATTFLDQLAPEAILADEVHNIRNASAVRTGRVLRHFAARPNTLFAGWSGSLTSESITDYTHLGALALREGSPTPLEPEVASEWAGAIDPSDNPAPPGALARLCGPHVKDPSTEQVRAAYQRHLIETPGVVTSTTPLVSVALTIRERQAPPLPPVVADALRDLRDTWCRPDGEEIVDALAFFRCARELACGFFYRWVFNHGEEPEDIDEWLTARKLWRAEMRGMLMRPQPHLDSPDLLAKAAARAYAGDRPGKKDLWWAVAENGERVPCWRAEHWPRWVKARPLVNRGRPPETEPVRMHPFLAEDAASWANANRGIVWYDKRAFGLWVAEIGGLPLHGGGPGAGARIEGLVKKGDGRSIVASIKSHGEGRDGLQYLFCDQLVAHPPSGPTVWEQMLGRLHRSGQVRDVTAGYYAHTPELAANVAKALNRADYVQDTIPGAKQKLLAGTL